LENKTVHWLDIGHVFLDEKGHMNRALMPDGLHPSIEGYRVWAQAMEPVIRKFLGEEQAGQGPLEPKSTPESK